MIIKEEDASFGRMQNVKRRFFALRNGDIAAMLRKAGSPYNIIFGLQLPQIVEVASASGIDDALADELWANSTTRESRLMAPMVVNREKFTIEKAREWISEVKSVEEADVLCHRLLRHLSYAPQVVMEFLEAEDSTDLQKYTALRLARNMIYSNSELARRACQAEGARKNSLTARLVAETLDELEFLKEA